MGVIIVMSIVAIVAFNLIRKAKIELIILKGMNWLILGVFSGIIIMAHFPVALTLYVVIWPLLYCTLPVIRGEKNKEWLLSQVFFVLWSILSIAVIFGTFLFHHTSDK